jgi:LGFP repeat
MRNKAVIYAVLASGCTADVAGVSSPPLTETPHLSTNAKLGRYTTIRDAASARGMANAYLLAGIANDETGLAMCWSEATWACQGPSSSECGGPVIAGSADGPCDDQQGGLGMFQFDAGTYTDTLGKYGNAVLTVAGQTSDAVDYAVWMVMVSDFTTNAETDDKARAWLDDFDPGNATLVDQWISTVVEYYNGCQPGWSCWSDRYSTYLDGFHLAITEPGGLSFWGASAGTTCGSSPAVVGEIEQKYLALGGCNSVFGVPTTTEQATPDGVGRYSVFTNGSIYWTPQTGAFGVLGAIRDEWAKVGWEAGILGYPLSDETTTPDAIGRYSVFQLGSIYWSAATGAHEMNGAIRDAWAQAGWEAGELGYPTSDEYAVAGGQRSDFQNGSVIWNQASGQTTINLNNGTHQ